MIKIMIVRFHQPSWLYQVYNVFVFYEKSDFRIYQIITFSKCKSFFLNIH